MRLKYESEIRSAAAWSFETARFFIGFYAEEEDTDPEDSFDLAEDIEFARSGRDGAWFCARVSVFLKDENPLWWRELGSDYLGACSYNSVREFYTGHRSADPANRNTLANKDRGIFICHYFTDMVRSAIEDARRTVQQDAAKYAAIAGSLRVDA